MYTKIKPQSQLFPARLSSLYLGSQSRFTATVGMTKEPLKDMGYVIIMTVLNDAFK